MNHILLVRSFFEHGLEGEFAVLELLKRHLIIIEPLDALSLPAIARLHLRNGVHQCIQVHHFALDPVANVDEWVDHFTRKCIELNLETGLTVAGDKSERLLALADGLLVGLLILVEEGGKLFVVPHLFFFHGHDLLDVLFEVLQVIHENLLLFDVLGDLSVVLLNLRVWQVHVRDLNVDHVPLEDEVGGGSIQLLEGVLDFAFWSEEHLDLRCLADVRELAQFDEEFVKVVLSLLDEVGRHVAFVLLGWHGRDEQARIAAVEEFSEGEELAVSPEAINLSEAVLTLDEIFGVLLHAHALGLVRDDLDFHEAIIALDVMHLHHH
jgi:hypothetical protein